MLLFVQILFFSRFVLLSLVFRVPVFKVYGMCLFLELPLLFPFVYCDIKRLSERIVLLSMLGNTVVFCFFSFLFFSPSFILKFNAKLSQCFHLCSFYYSNGSFLYALNFVLNAKVGRISVLTVVFI